MADKFEDTAMTNVNPIREVGDDAPQWGQDGVRSEMRQPFSSEWRPTNRYAPKFAGDGDGLKDLVELQILRWLGCCSRMQKLQSASR